MLPGSPNGAHTWAYDISGHDIVDGGVGSNFGIEMVVSQEPEFIEAMGIEPDRDRVVGLYT